MICFEFVFLLFNINYFVPECLDPAEFLLVLSQRDPPTAVHASIQESVGAVDLGPCTAVPTIMDNTPGFPDLDSSLDCFPCPLLFHQCQRNYHLFCRLKMVPTHT